MVWFKVDDDFHDHPKTWDLSSDAVALWTRAGSWSAGHLTGGVVTRDMCVRWCDNSVTSAAELVAHGLWVVTDDERYAFHDWPVYNPSRRDVEKVRKQGRLRQRSFRDRRRESREGNGVTGSVTGEVRNDRVTPPRPDPTRRVEGRGGSEVQEEQEQTPRGQPSGRGRAAAARSQPPADPECPVCRGPHPLKDCAIQEGSDAGRSRPQLGRPPDSVAKEGAEGARELMRGTMAGRPLTASPQPGHWRDPQATARAQVAGARQLRGESGGGDDGLPDEIPF